MKRRWLGVSLLLAASGCALLPTQEAPLAPELVGQVRMAALGYRAQATSMGQVADAATVSLIDVADNRAIASNVTTTEGKFSLVFGRSFRPSASASYYVEAIKGLDSNSAGKPAARVRTLVRYQDGKWVSLTGEVMNVTEGSTAVSVIVNHRGKFPAVAVDAIGLMGKLAYNVPDPTLSPTTADTFNAKADYPHLKNAEYHQVYGMVQAALSQDRDPLAGIAYESGSDSFVLSNSGASTLNLTPPAATGASVGQTLTIKGLTFSSNPANNVVTLNGVAASSVWVSADRQTATCSIPLSAKSGPLAVTVDGATYGVPTYVVLSSAEIAISSIDR
ncbi:MAG TPA: IPT/TIG domain-containing protein [Pantanalinema sp.]